MDAAVLGEVNRKLGADYVMISKAVLDDYENIVTGMHDYVDMLKARNLETERANATLNAEFISRHYDAILSRMNDKIVYKQLDNIIIL